MTEQRRALGARGERAAARWLTDHGLQVVATNWRCAAGEIDIVAVDHDTLVIVEVKTRRSARFGTPAEAVGPEKLRRLSRLAAAYLEAHPHRYRAVRVDVIAVLARAGSLWLRHLRGVSD